MSNANARQLTDEQQDNVVNCVQTTKSEDVQLGVEQCLRETQWNVALPAHQWDAGTLVKFEQHLAKEDNATHIKECFQPVYESLSQQCANELYPRQA